MVTRIAHVCLVVSDLPRSLEFYKNVFKIEEKFRFLKNDRQAGAYLEISPGNFIEFFDGRKGDVVNNGITHFCLETESLDTFSDHLGKLGVPHTPKKLGSDNSYQIWITDLDGNRIEIHEYTDRSSQYTGADAMVTW